MHRRATVEGRDAVLPARHAVARVESSRPRFDSLVLNSTGVCALTMAGRVARAPEFAGRVDIVGKPAQESRRLVGGVTLRARTIDYYAEAMGVDSERVLTEIYGPKHQRAETKRQCGALCAGSPESGFRVVRNAIFMDSERRRANRTERQPLAYGVRNSRLLATLERLALEAGARLTPEPADSLESLSRHARGTNPLIVNATPQPVGGAAITHQPPAPKKFVAAAQMALRASFLEKRGLIQPQTSFVCWVLRDGAMDMGVFYPFQDVLSPSADYYGIFYRVVSAEEARRNRQELERLLADTVVGIADAFGLEAVDREKTLGTAVVPVSPWHGVNNRQSGVLDLSRIAGAGSPIITGDGMTKSAIAGLVAAESFFAGREAVQDIDRALRRYRQLNLELHLAITSFARIAAFLMRVHPNLVLFRQSRSYHWDMWAGAH